MEEDDDASLIFHPNCHIKLEVFIEMTKYTVGLVFWLLRLDGRNSCLRNVSAHLLTYMAS